MYILKMLFCNETMILYVDKVIAYHVKMQSTCTACYQARTTLLSTMLLSTNDVVNNVVQP